MNALIELFGDAQQDVAGHPQLVRHLQRGQRPDLELPLRRHDLCIRAADLNSGTHARLQVLVYYFPTEAAVATHAAVIRALCPASGIGVTDPLIRMTQILIRF